jgi:hypothetical protein
MSPHRRSARQEADRTARVVRARIQADLKLLDEILCDLKTQIAPAGQFSATWAEVERHSSTTRDAMARLRRAWKTREMPAITLSLAQYFESGDG